MRLHAVFEEGGRHQQSLPRVVEGMQGIPSNPIFYFTKFRKAAANCIQSSCLGQPAVEQIGKKRKLQQTLSIILGEAWAALVTRHPAITFSGARISSFSC